LLIAYAEELPFCTKGFVSSPVLPSMPPPMVAVELTWHKRRTPFSSAASTTFAVPSAFTDIIAGRSRGSKETNAAQW
jgi:hypothetical protein